MAPSRVYLYRNEQVVDADIMNDKKPIQQIELGENLTGDAEYPVNQAKFSNISSLVLGFNQNYGAARTGISFIGIRGDFLRLKPKIGEIVYELQGNYSKLN